MDESIAVVPCNSSSYGCVFGLENETMKRAFTNMEYVLEA